MSQTLAALYLTGTITWDEMQKVTELTDSWAASWSAEEIALDIQRALAIIRAAAPEQAGD